MEQKFVSEPIKPVVATADPHAMTTGGPALPREFTWRGTVLGITAVLRTWHETGPYTHGSSESYVRKHWFEVETTSNQRAKIYFERQPRARKLTRRWWLFSIEKKTNQPLHVADDGRVNNLISVKENADEYRDNS